MCNACLKFVNYAFFFWLPFYLTHKYGWAESEANRLAIWYDVGGIFGSVLGGIASDRLGHRCPVLMVLLVSSLPLLLIYSGIGSAQLVHIILMTLLGLTISGPYNLIVGTIAIDLGSQPALAGNAEVFLYKFLFDDTKRENLGHVNSYRAD
jgi:OPA family glycerol-3-phosphate transporter-like MFS transporter 3